MNILLSNSEQLIATFMSDKHDQHWIVFGPDITPMGHGRRFRPGMDRFVWLYDSNEPHTDTYVDSLVILAQLGVPTPS